MEKVKTTIKQFYRDWSAEVGCHDNQNTLSSVIQGQAERDSCYKPIIDEIKKRFPPTKWYDINVVAMMLMILSVIQLKYQCWYLVLGLVD